MIDMICGSPLQAQLMQIKCDNVFTKWQSFVHRIISTHCPNHHVNSSIQKNKQPLDAPIGQQIKSEQCQVTNC